MTFCRAGLDVCTCKQEPEAAKGLVYHGLLGVAGICITAPITVVLGHQAQEVGSRWPVLIGD